MPMVLSNSHFYGIIFAGRLMAQRHLSCSHFFEILHSWPINCFGNFSTSLILNMLDYWIMRFMVSYSTYFQNLLITSSVIMFVIDFLCIYMFLYVYKICLILMFCKESLCDGWADWKMDYTVRVPNYFVGSGYRFVMGSCLGFSFP